jgi:hypothetical protein
MAKNLIILTLILSLSGGAYFSFGIIDKLKGAITSLTLQHKKQIVKTKVKERGKRLLAAIPIVGLIAVGWFEKEEYEEWKEENPIGTIEAYTKEMTLASKEVAYVMTAGYCDDIGEYCDYLKNKINDLESESLLDN